jgi:hypothetical protein
MKNAVEIASGGVTYIPKNCYEEFYLVEYNAI